ncbi:MAG: hypothetical protein PHS09_05030 [Candidatus Omnitrophica bacterium]|nr:hypothetical protein [Candidatus Omnitrophota bacterium]
MKKPAWKCLLLVMPLAWFFCGCTLIEYREQIGVLQNFSESQDEIKQHVNSQAELFKELEKDIRENRVRPGTPKGRVIARYGEPLRCTRGEDLQETCLYRHPTEYFSSDHVYLYFDREARLYRQEIRPFND